MFCYLASCNCHPPQIVNKIFLFEVYILVSNVSCLNTGTYTRIMNQYLSKCKLLASSVKSFCIIIGNETCDLDSAISSICFALFLSKNVDYLAEKAKRFPIVPMMNIRRDEIPLKTDVNYFLKRNKIDVNNLICNDEIPMDTLLQSDFILVDHHVSRYSNRAIQIIDHRPFDQYCTLPLNCCRTIEQVGSCATLIADYIIKANEKFNRVDIQEIFRLLYGPIILDTLNFSAQANRAQPLDFEVSEEIRFMLQLTADESTNLFRDLYSARVDAANLNASEILMKDLKIVVQEVEVMKELVTHGKLVAISACTMLCQDFVKLHDAHDGLVVIREKYKCDLLIILGMSFTEDLAVRDFGVINFTDSRLLDTIYTALIADEYLNVKPNNECNFAHGRYGSHNSQATRKHVIPIVRQSLQQISI